MAEASVSGRGEILQIVYHLTMKIHKGADTVEATNHWWALRVKGHGGKFDVSVLGVHGEPRDAAAMGALPRDQGN